MADIQNLKGKISLSREASFSPRKRYLKRTTSLSRNKNVNKLKLYTFEKKDIISGIGYLTPLYSRSNSVLEKVIGRICHNRLKNR